MMNQKNFYRIGVFFIVCWGLSLLYAAVITYEKPVREYAVEKGWVDAEKQNSLSDETKMSAGESWMVLRRVDKPMGFIHQKRTKTPTGWLLENDLKIGVELMGKFHKLSTKIKATLREDTSLVSFTADVKSQFASLTARGTVIPEGIDVSYKLGANETHSIIPISRESVKNRTSDGIPILLLAETIPAKLAANRGVRKGMGFSQQYFDPTSMSMKSSRWIYEGPDEIPFFDTTIKGNRFTQEIAGTELATIVDENGEVVYQRLPLDIDAVAYREDVAKALISRIDREWSEEERLLKQTTDTSGAKNPVLAIAGDALESGSILQQLSDLSTKSDETKKDTLEQNNIPHDSSSVDKYRYNVVIGVSSNLPLALTSGRQLAKRVDIEHIEKEGNSQNINKNDADKEWYQITTDLKTSLDKRCDTCKIEGRGYLNEMLANSFYIDVDSTEIQQIIEQFQYDKGYLKNLELPLFTDSPESNRNSKNDETKAKIEALYNQKLKTASANRERVAAQFIRYIQKTIDFVGDVRMRRASDIIREPVGDCTEASLLLLTLLRSVHIEARFVYGLKRNTKGEWIPHMWVQYWNGYRFVDIDPTQVDGVPSEDTIQLFVSNQPADPTFATIATKVKVINVPQESVNNE